MKFNNILKSLIISTMFLNINTFSMEKDTNDETQNLESEGAIRAPSPFEHQDESDEIDQQTNENNDQEFHDDWSDNEQDNKEKSEEDKVKQAQEQLVQESKKKNESRLPSLNTMKLDALIKLLEENTDVVLDEPYIKSIKLTHLMFAAQQNHERLVAAILKSQKNKDVNAQDDIGYSALHYAAIEGNPKVITALLQAGADKTKPSKDGNTPYMLAMEHRKVAAASLLQATVQQNSIAQSAAQPVVQPPVDHNLPAKALATEGKDVPAQTNIEDNAATASISSREHDEKGNKEKQNKPVAKAWLEPKNRQEYIDLLKKTAQHISLDEGTIDLLSLILIDAAAFNDEEFVDLILACPDLDLTIREPEHGHNALTMATKFGNLGIVIKLLKSKKINVDEPDKDGTTALIWACIKDFPIIVKTLVEAGANINTQDQFGESALLRTAIKGNSSTVALLLSKGAIINTFDRDGNTPLCEACRMGHLEVAKILLQHNAQRSFGGDQRLLQLYKADVNRKDNEGKMPLIFAIKSNHPKIVKLIIDHKPDLTVTYRGKNALQIAQDNRYKTEKEQSANKAICALLMPLFNKVSEQNYCNFLDELDKEAQKEAKEKQRKKDKKERKKARDNQSNVQVDQPSPRQSAQSPVEQDQTKQMQLSKEDKIKKLEVELAKKENALAYFQKKLMSKKNNISSNNASPNQPSNEQQQQQFLVKAIQQAKEEIQQIREQLSKLKS